MKNKFKLNSFILFNLINLNIYSLEYKNLKSNLKSSFATYSSIFILKTMGHEIMYLTTKSIKEKKLDDNLIEDIAIIPPLIGNFFLFKDSVHKESDTETSIINKIELLKFFKALFTNKNGYISLLKSGSCLANICLTLYGIKNIFNYSENSNSFNKEVPIAYLPAFYGIYRLAQSSKKSFNKAYQEVNK